MEIIEINSENYKIILSESDLASFGTNSKSFTSDYESSKNVLSAILIKLYEKNGIISKPDSILVQFFPSRYGGGELFLSYKKKEYYSKRVLNRAPGCNRLHTAVFESLEDMILLLHRFRNDKYFPKSDLFYDGRHYILCIYQNNTVKDLPDYIHEYARVCFTDELTAAKLCEHTECICKDNAAEIISAHF